MANVTSRVSLALVLGAGLALAPSVARADVAPGPGQVDTCTPEKQATPADECLRCRAFHGNPDNCATNLASYGFAQKCRGPGASVWGEVWCRKKAADAKPVPANVLGALSDPTGGKEAAQPNVPPSPGGATAGSTPGAADGTSSAAPPGAAPSPPSEQPTGGRGGCAIGASPTAVAVPVLAAFALVLAFGARRSRPRR